MVNFTSRFQRLELKFLVGQDVADRVRRQIEPYCMPDTHCRAAAQGRAGRVGYPIESLYLDSPALALHAAKERGDPNRVKLRIRTYSSTSPGLLEVKRRRANIIDKTRAIVNRDQVEEAASGRFQRPAGGPTDSRVVDEFSLIAAAVGAEPTLTVRYDREAYMSIVDDYARVTFDRRIQVRRADGWTLNPETSDWCHFDEHWGSAHPTPPIVMEIKCEHMIPAWISDVVQNNELQQSSFSKYSIGIEITNRAMGRFARSRSYEALR